LGFRAKSCALVCAFSRKRFPTTRQEKTDVLCIACSSQSGGFMRVFQSLSRWIWCLFIVFVRFTHQSNAQSPRGEMAGNVTDTSGAGVVGARIVAVAIETRSKSETVTT